MQKNDLRAHYSVDTMSHLIYVIRVTGRQLKELREQLDWTQERLAKELDVDRRTVIRWEKEEVKIAKPEEMALKSIKKRWT